MSKSIKASEIDKRFDNGEDVSEFFDMDNPIVEYAPAIEAKRVNVTMPTWLIDELDSEARRLTISRQAVVVTWLAEKAEEKANRLGR